MEILKCDCIGVDHSPSCRYPEFKEEPNMKDFGWAIGQLRAGNQVRRKQWLHKTWWELGVNTGRILEFSGESTEYVDRIEHHNFMATDWELYGEN